MTEGIRQRMATFSRFAFFVINKSLKEATTVIKSR
jgi:hypothetical protein